MALLHSLKDTSGFVDTLFINTAENLSEVGIISGYQMSPIQIIFIAVDLLLAAFLLRKSKQQKIFDRIEKMNSELAEF